MFERTDSEECFARFRHGRGASHRKLRCPLSLVPERERPQPPWSQQGPEQDLTRRQALLQKLEAKARKFWAAQRARPPTRRQSALHWTLQVEKVRSEPEDTQLSPLCASTPQREANVSYFRGFRFSASAPPGRLIQLSVEQGKRSEGCEASLGPP